MDIAKGKDYWHKVTGRQKEVLREMNAQKVLEVHSDGDLTFEAGAPPVERIKRYVLTTEGDLFVEVPPGVRRMPMVDDKLFSGKQRPLPRSAY